jgi:hypothetical protein
VSQSVEKPSDEPLVQPSQFGRRLGIIVTIAFIVLALLAAVGTFATGDSNQSPEPIKSTTPF